MRAVLGFWRVATMVSAVAVGVFSPACAGERETLPASRVALFAYDPEAPLNTEHHGVERRGSVEIHDVSFAAGTTPTAVDRGRTRAFIVAPQGGESCAGVLWVHWLGEPATTSRVQFLDEAVALAERGVVSILPDAMWSAPHWYRDRILEEDFANSVRQVIALRRALDLLRAQPRVDAARIGLVAHDYGAMYGAIALALDGGVKTAVLIAATPSFNDWAFFAKKPASMEAYLKQNAPLELRDFLGAIRGAGVLMQFGGKDEYVSEAGAKAFSAAVPEPKRMLMYPDSGHEMTHPEAIRSDRTAWLVEHLGL